MNVANKSIVIRSSMFGFEDGLVSTVGLLSGIAVAGVPNKTIILTGIVLVCVEALSMGIGSFLSEETVEEGDHKKNAFRISFNSGVAMLLSYLIAGLIPLIPYFIGDSLINVYLSISITLISLLFLGLISANYAKISMLKNALRVLLLGGATVIIGVVIGNLIPPV